MNFVVMGAGAWGTAFALHLARNGNSVALVPRRTEQALDLAARRENVEYLPGVELPSGILIITDLSDVVRRCDVILLACPAQSLRETAARARVLQHSASLGNQHVAP